MNSLSSRARRLPGTLCVLIALFAIALLAAPVRASTVTWVGGNSNWLDGFLNDPNWNPGDEPDPGDTAIFNTANTVNMGTNNSILALTLSGGIDLNTNNFDLDVNGLVQLSGSSTNFIVGGSASALTADSITLNSGATLELNGGTITIDEESGLGLLDINAGGELAGHGTLSMADDPNAVTLLVVNDGVISARRAPLTPLGAPEAGTLTLKATHANTRIDLDGTDEDGVVNVFRNQTLDLNFRLADAFGGTINLFQDAKLDVSAVWTLDSGTINVDNGFIAGTLPSPDIPAGISTITGGTLTQSGGTINVLDHDGTLRFDSVFIMSGGVLENNGLLEFRANATIAPAAFITMPSTSSSLKVSNGSTVTINQANFNLDGKDFATNVITVTGGSALTVHTGDYDPDSETNAFDGTINLDNSIFAITTSDAEFIMDGVLNSRADGGVESSWGGEALDIGNDAGLLDAEVNITGSQPTKFDTQVDFNSDANVDVAAGATVHFLDPVNFNGVNGANHAEFTGSGEMIFNASVNFSEVTTLDMPGGIVDLDGTDSTGDTINIDAPVTINVATLRSFGNTNSAGTNVLDVNNFGGTGVLSVNLDQAGDEWTLNAQGEMNLVNNNAESTLLTGSGVNLDGTVNVSGNVRVESRVDISGTIHINTANQPLSLAGGNFETAINTISGGTITGVGILRAEAGIAFEGFGTIDTDIRFGEGGFLRATGGTLTINGEILAMDTLAAGPTGTLNVVNPWSADAGVIGTVALSGGTLQGGTVTVNNANGIRGFGVINSRVVNNTRIVAASGPTLVVQTAANDNDWDGTTNAGLLHALSGNLELRGTGTFGFLGTVEAENGHEVFANGFGLDFGPGSTLAINGGGTYRSTATTNIGGAVTIGLGGVGNIEVQGNSSLTFQSTSATTLSSDLWLLNSNIRIEQGATFSGPGAIVIPEGSRLVVEDGADLEAPLNLRGEFRPADFDGVGQVDLQGFQMLSTGQLFAEIAGASLSDFDRVVVDGNAAIDGYLNIDLTSGFVPIIDSTFNILTATSVSGQFDFADFSGMPAGLTFRINYLPDAVQLQVVATPDYAADFDGDGDVDPTDLAIWQTAYGLNQQGDTDGDNDSDGRDFLAWQRQFGSKPLVAAATPVPEPSTLLLAVTASWLALRRRAN